MIPMEDDDMYVTHIAAAPSRENGGCVPSKCGIFIWPHDVAPDEMLASCTKCIAKVMAETAAQIVASA